MGTRVECRKFTPNIFNKSKCSSCFRSREEHSAAALESNRATRKVSKCGYLFVAPDWDFTNPLYRTKRWQRRWFVLYDDGELTYSVDEHPETVPQAIIDMTKVLEVTTAEDVTSHINSLAITAPDRVTFVKGTCPEEAKWWLNILAAFPKTKGRHKRNATFPGGQATTIIQSQPLQAGRNRHNSYHKDTTLPSPVSNIDAISTSWSSAATNPADENNINANNENNNSRVYTDQPVSSKSPPTRDKLHPEGKAQARIRNRNRSSQDATDSASQCMLLEDARRDEKLKDIANTITNLSLHHHGNNRWSTQCILPPDTNVAVNEKPTRDENSYPDYNNMKTQVIAMRPKSLQITSPSTPSIVSAIVKKIPSTAKLEMDARNNNNNNNTQSSLIRKQQQQQSGRTQKLERGDPDGGCLDDVPILYLNKNSELRVNLPAEELLNSKKGWLMKQDNRSGDWNKHWFTLRGAALFYYRDPVAEDRGVLDGVLDVNSITSIAEVPVTKNFGFQLLTWDNRRIVLSAVTVSIRNNWINVLKTAAGLAQNITSDNNQTNIDDVVVSCKQPLDNTTEIIIVNSSDDVKSAIEKDFMKAQKDQDIIINNLANNDDMEIDDDHHHHHLYSGSNKENDDLIITNNNNNNNNNNSNNKNINNSVLITPTIKGSTTPLTPLTQKSILFSSDEEYRTASEGGRRDSVDWGSPMSPSPPLPISLSMSMTRTKDRIRSRSNSRSRLHKRSRSSPPTSRRSTIDSVGSDDLPPINVVQEEICLDKELQLRMNAAEKELTLLREEAHEREARMSELLTTLERTEVVMTARKREAEEARDKLAMQLTESRNSAQDIIEKLTAELDKSRDQMKDLEDRLARGIEENEHLYKKLREVGISSPTSSLCSLNRNKIKRMDSFSDLTSLNEIDPNCLDKDMLTEEYNELRVRFEKAVNELKAMKRELKDSHNLFDNLEISHATLQKEMTRMDVEQQSQGKMMADRIQDLASKYSAAEKQVRSLRQKLMRSEKRRSLSLKGKESLSIQKELEDKVTELEIKIDAIESGHVEVIPAAVVAPESPTPAEPVDERSLKKSSSRLRRKSLDSASPQPMAVLLRLNALEKRIESSCSVINNNNNTSNVNNNNNNSGTLAATNTNTKISEHLIERLKSLEGVVITSRDIIEQSLQQFQNLKSSKSRRSVSPIADKKDSYKFVERCLTEATKLLRDSCDNCLVSECTANNNLIIIPETSPIKLALTQLEAQLRTKLSDLLKQRRMLREKNELTQRNELELLAERIAFESVCFGKLRDAIGRAENTEQFGEKQSKSEIAETAQLMAMLRGKLSGKCVVKPNGSLDILAGVLARRLILTAGRTAQLKAADLTPVNSNILDDLLRQQNELNIIAKRYKTNAMENLAYGLAAETLSYISSNDAVQGAVQEAWRQAQETVNAELVQSEIAHIMMRNAQRYENAITPAFGYTLTSQERISFENFADAVQDALRREMEVAINQLTQCYDESLAKMKRGQWRLHLEQERKASEGRQLLAEFADIVAHKALVDARISVLKGDYVPREQLSSKENYFSVNTLQKYENLFAELSSDLELSNPDDILAEADFNFMFKYFTTDFVTNRAEVKEIANMLNSLEKTINHLSNVLNPNETISTSTSSSSLSPAALPSRSAEGSEASGESVGDGQSLQSLSRKCKELQTRIESIIGYAHMLQSQCDECDKMQDTLGQLTNQHEKDLLQLHQRHEQQLGELKATIEEQQKLIKLIDSEKDALIEKLNNEKNLVKLREDDLSSILAKLKSYETMCHNKSKETDHLLATIAGESEKMTLFREKYEELLDNYNKQSIEQIELEKDRDFVIDQLNQDQELIKKLEKHIEMSKAEHAQQIDNLHAAYREQQVANEIDSQKDKDDENSLRQRYQAEIEQLRVLCEKGLAAMESSHKRIISELEEKHQDEIQGLLCEKEQALAEETQATLAALDAMRKAHESEVQREVARFKQEFIKQFKKGGAQSSTTYREQEQELEDVRQEILSLSEKYSYKCVETASLEEKLRLATQQLKISQQNVHQLDYRNKQLRAHFVSDDSDLSSLNSLASKSSESNAVNMHDDETHSSTTTSPAENAKENHVLNNKKEIYPRLKFSEGAKLGLSQIYSSIESTKSKILTPKTFNMNLINLSCNRTNEDDLPATNGSAAVAGSTGVPQSALNAATPNSPTSLCLPPPSDIGKDVEQMHRFELEI